MKLNQEEISRYKRHLCLPGFGEKGQLLLKESKVLIIGLGGLGSPVALYLCAAGVGTLGLADFDEVDFSNLQRQILYGENDVGKSKAQISGLKLKDINSHINLKTHHEKLDEKNILEIFKEYDLIIDGSDNFPTRYLVNDACVFLNKTFLHGSVHRFSGQVALFLENDQAPCLRCLYPFPPNGGMNNCSQAGVLGTVTGIIGTLMANEAVKHLAKIGSNLSNSLLVIDALETKMEKYFLGKDDSCPICSKNASIKSLSAQLTHPEITYKDLDKDFYVLDVREKDEWNTFNIGGTHIPLGELSSRLLELGLLKDQKIAVVCYSGQRSLDACTILKNNNFTNVFNLQGGIAALGENGQNCNPM